MYQDFFYELIHAKGFVWILIGLAFAVFDIIFNIIMCWITGGIQAVQTTGTGNLGTVLRAYKTSIPNYVNIFLEGGKSRYDEFRADPLSISWPLLVLFWCTFLYGYTRYQITEADSLLTSAGIPLFSHFSFLQYTQYILLLIAITFGVNTYWRYKAKTIPIWFTKSNFFHLSRIVIFNFSLTYMVLNIIVLWLIFNISLIILLLNSTIEYHIFYPDLMYGLKPIYDLVINNSLLLLLASFLPSLMLLREKHSPHKWMYYYGFYAALSALIIIDVVVIILFNQKLGYIQTYALSNIFNNLPDNFLIFSQENNWVEMYSLIMALPNGFPIPKIIEYLLSARALILIFEIIQITKKDSDDIPFSQKLNLVIRKVLDG